MGRQELKAGQQIRPMGKIQASSDCTGMKAQALPAGKQMINIAVMGSLNKPGLAPDRISSVCPLRSRG